MAKKFFVTDNEGRKYWSNIKRGSTHPNQHHLASVLQHDLTVLVSAAVLLSGNSCQARSPPLPSILRHIVTQGRAFFAPLSGRQSASLPSLTPAALWGSKRLAITTSSGLRQEYQTKFCLSPQLSKTYVFRKRCGHPDFKVTNALEFTNA
jgi:hypothetical protein